MARNIGAVCKLCRREGEKLFLKGDRCSSPKCAFERRPYPGGQHGKASQFRRKESDYGRQLRAKQKARRVYGVMERQFRRYFADASQQRGMTGANLLIMLESRLDSVVYRLGFASSRAQARQLVRHGHFDLNGRKVDIPSCLVRPGDVVAVRSGSRQSVFFRTLVEDLQHRAAPEWLARDDETLSGRVLALPARGDVSVDIQEQLIVEYYSR
jgi:small subunit ribosomal protein S4